MGGARSDSSRDESEPGLGVYGRGVVGPSFGRGSGAPGRSLPGRSPGLAGPPGLSFGRAPVVPGVAEVVHVLESIRTELTRNVGPLPVVPRVAEALPGDAAAPPSNVPLISTWWFRCFDTSAV